MVRERDGGAEGVTKHSTEWAYLLLTVERLDAVRTAEVCCTRCVCCDVCVSTVPAPDHALLSKGKRTCVRFNGKFDYEGMDLSSSTHPRGVLKITDYSYESVGPTWGFLGILF